MNWVNWICNDGTIREIGLFPEGNFCCCRGIKWKRKSMDRVIRRKLNHYSPIVGMS